MKGFNIVDKGYDKKQVNDFINKTIKDEEVLINKIKSLKTEVNSLNKKIELLNNNNESNIIIDTAKSNANLIINDALIKANSLEEKSRKIELEINKLTKKLKILSSDLDIFIDSIEK